MRARWWQRGLAAISGVLIVWAGLLLALGAFMVGASFAVAPDPMVPAEDMSFNHPDTWGEVANGVAASLAMTVVVAVLLGAAIALLGLAAWGRAPGRGAWLWSPMIAFGFVLGVFVVTLVPKLDEARAKPNCATFVPDRAAIRDPDPDSRRTQAYALTECHVLEGKTLRQVHALLGPPTDEPYGAQPSFEAYPPLMIDLRKGRVTSTWVDPG